MIKIFLDSCAFDWFYRKDIYQELPQKYCQLFITSEVTYELNYAQDTLERKEKTIYNHRIIKEYPIKVFKPFGLLSKNSIDERKHLIPSNDIAHYGGFGEGYFVQKSVRDFLNSECAKRHRTLSEERKNGGKLRPSGLRLRQSDITLAALSTVNIVLTADDGSILKEARKELKHKIVLLKEVENSGLTVYDYILANFTI